MLGNRGESSSDYGWIRINEIENSRRTHLENIVVFCDPIPIPPLGGVFMDIGIRFEEVEAVLVA